MDDPVSGKPRAIQWSRRAAQDLEEIVIFIAQERPEAALQTLERLGRAVESLAGHPLMGRMIPEIGRHAFRELIRGRYRIAYQVTRTRIRVLTVFDSKRQIPLGVFPKAKDK